MNRITQEAYFRKRMLKYAETHSKTETAIRYRVSRKTLHKWINRYDGTIASLKDRSRKPHHHPNAQTEDELKMAYNRYKRDPGGDKLVMWHYATKAGYTRCYQSFLRALRRMDVEVKRQRRRKAKPYEPAVYPGQKMQADVKYVPTNCIEGEAKEMEEKFYQFTMIDEFSRLTFRQVYNEHSTYSAEQFLVEAIDFYRKHGINIEWIQTDNGTEWTKALIASDPNDKTSWELKAEENGIKLTRIRIATPRHNGKVERQHRKDEQRFYRKLRVSSLSEGRKKLAAYNKRSAHYPIISLEFKSPLEMLEEYKRKSNYGQLALAC